MNDLITVFRMSEITNEAKIKIIIKLGELINCQYASNVSEPIVYELVLLLDPKHPIGQNEHYLSCVRNSN